MLFDLKGRRRRLVQGTYLILAVLMGGGLVLFGIGGEVSGGLVDAISGGKSDSGNALIKDRVKKSEKQIAANPKNEAVLKELIRDNYQLAGDDQDQQTGVFGADGKKKLAQLAGWWGRYQTVQKSPAADTARYAIFAYGPNGLNKPAQATAAAEIFANGQKPADAAQAYLQLTACATLAGQTRKATLAGQKAAELAPAKQRKSVAAIVAQAKSPQTAKQLCGQG